MSGDCLSIENSIDNGVNFLYHQQLPNGEFKSYFSNNEKMEEYSIPDEGWYVLDANVFPSILIGSSLLFLKDSVKAEIILSKITGFLLAERKTGSLWNHYSRNHELFHLCPFDADDTACASAFLKYRNVEFASNIDVLLSNRSKNNLFYTWFTLRFKLNLNISYLRVALRELKRPIKSLIFWSKMECERNDVDAVVNANVLFYLGKKKDTLPIINYLIDVIIKGKENDCDKWYKNKFTIYYFISRNYFAGIEEFHVIRQVIIDKVIQGLNSDGSFGESVLDTGLAICILLNFKYTPKELTESIKSLLKAQQANGNWKKNIFYYNGPNKLIGFGSDELTTGICLEALVRYKELMCNN